MLAETSGLKGAASGHFTGAAMFQVPATDFKSRHVVLTGTSFLFGDGTLTHLAPTVNWVPFVDERRSKGRQSGRRVEWTARMGLVLKRSMDVVLSAIALILLWPVMLVIAITIKLESRHRVIYPSLRVGEKGRRFICYKFRTMVEGADRLKGSLRRLNQRRGPFFKIAGDPRVTRFGRFLRKYSLDELPQFWNVLKGDMSLVGPRPHPVDDVELYSPEHFGRLDVKPGLTGLWQVTARAIPSFDTCMRLDLVYIEKWNLLLDCRILMKTIPAVLAGDGE